MIKQSISISLKDVQSIITSKPVIFLKNGKKSLQFEKFSPENVPSLMDCYVSSFMVKNGYYLLDVVEGLQELHNPLEQELKQESEFLEKTTQIDEMKGKGIKREEVLEYFRYKSWEYENNERNIFPVVKLTDVLSWTEGKGIKREEVLEYFRYKSWEHEDNERNIFPIVKLTDVLSWAEES